MVDETYTMADAGSDSEVLITYDHPKSMKTIAWTRQYRKSPVFCLEQGHDHLSWNNRSFRMILQRGIMWCTRNPVMDIAGTCSAGAPLACQG